MLRLEKARSRTDLSDYVIHLTKGDESFEILGKIIKDLEILPSKQLAITVYEPEGAACFYDCPIEIIKDVIQSSPSNRKPHGIMVPKTEFWDMGGRPAIYTDLNKAEERTSVWPKSQAFRLINTNLCRTPDPIDWTHEREWRVKGEFPLGGFVTWKCLVNTAEEAESLYDRFGLPYSFYVLEENADYSALDIEWKKEMEAEFVREMRSELEREMRSYYS